MSGVILLTIGSLPNTTRNSLITIIGNSLATYSTATVNDEIKYPKNKFHSYANIAAGVKTKGLKFPISPTSDVKVGILSMILDSINLVAMLNTNIPSKNSIEFLHECKQKESATLRLLNHINTRYDFILSFDKFNKDYTFIDELKNKMAPLLAGYGVNKQFLADLARNYLNFIKIISWQASNIINLIPKTTFNLKLLFTVVISSSADKEENKDISELITSKSTAITVWNNSRKKSKKTTVGEVKKVVNEKATLLKVAPVSDEKSILPEVAPVSDGNNILSEIAIVSDEKVILPEVAVSEIAIVSDEKVILQEVAVSAVAVSAVAVSAVAVSAVAVSAVVEAEAAEANAAEANAEVDEYASELYG